MKRILSLVLAVILISSFGMINTEAAESPKVVIDGKPVDFVTPPTIINGRTMVEMTSIFNEFGYSFDWNAEERTVHASKDEFHLTLSIGNQTASSSEASQSPIYYTLEVAPTIINDKTMVPLRFVSEVTGASVDWNANTRTVTVMSGDNSLIPIASNPENWNDGNFNYITQSFQDGVKMTVSELTHSSEGMANLVLSLTNTTDETVYLYGLSVSGRDTIDYSWKKALSFGDVYKLEPM